ncbi:MAG: HesA/MoeB/ThiF family protein [Gammaproteobacteria bacterium]|nr:HesA/MoeB/ThiF family protein [Gammaproteobacteria bacterium]
MDDKQLERYSRHILLPEIDLSGQEKLIASKVLLVGLGGLGSPTALYLAASGIGEIIINDHDTVDLGNLQRQIVHTTLDQNRQKTESAREHLHAINPGIDIHTIERRLTAAELAQYADRVDVVIDASDNFTTRYAINRACVDTRTPLVWGAATRFDGQATTFRNDHEEGPCLNCLYPHRTARDGMDSCSEIGVFAPLTGIIGSIMAAEALKLLVGTGLTLQGRLLQINAATLECRQSRFTRDPLCESCTPAVAPLIRAEMQ